MTILPPGFSTRTISSTYAFLSGMCSPLSQAHTKSKVLSSNSISNAFITRNCAFGTPCSFANSVARFTWLGESVIPVTVVPSPNVFAKCRDVPPMPHPTSNTSAGFSVSLHFAISSTKSNFA